MTPNLFRTLIREAGLWQALRFTYLDLRNAVLSDPRRFVALVRGWRLSLALAGMACTYFAPVPDFHATTLEAHSLVLFTTMVGAGLAFTLLALTNLLATFNAALMAAGFRAGYLGMVVRIPVAALILVVSLQYQGTLAYWMLGCLSLVTWIVWPSVQQLLAIQEAALNRFSGLGATSRALARYKRALPEQVRELLAMHEAGHALFFGLGDVLPEDAYVWIREDVPWGMEDAATAGSKQLNKT